MKRFLYPSQLFILLSIFCSSLSLGIQEAQAGTQCEKIFGSRLHYDKKVLERKDFYAQFHSDFFNLIEERKLQKTWGTEKNTPKLFQKILPEGAGFLPYQLRQPQTPTTVKLEESALALVVRAKYKYKGTNLYTNVTVSKKIFDDNLNNPVKGLAGVNAQAAIIFLHGGGTKSTGGHVGEALVNHFSGLNIDIVSPDLPWHGQGPREFLGDFRDEIRSLGAFAKKYIPENVPLFVWGHSWGAVYADEIMRMSEDPDFAFHPNFKGVIIAAPGVDSAPGKNPVEKEAEFVKRFLHMKANLRGEFAEQEANIFDMPGIISPVGNLFAEFTMNQINQILPEHGGDKYIPSIMIVGEADPMVYVGRGDLFHAYYDKLSNLEAYYLNNLPLEKDPKGPKYKVGHLLRDYADPETNSTPVDFYYVKKFIAEQLNIDKLEKNPRFRQTTFTDIAHLWANSLSFRLWVEDYTHTLILKTKKIGMIRGEIEKLRNKINISFLKYLPSNRIVNLVNELTKEDSSKSFEELKEEADILFEMFSNQKSLNKKLEQMLLEIKDAGNKEKMRLVVKNLGENSSQFLPVKINSIKTRSKEFIQLKNALTSYNSEDLQSILKKFKVDEESKELILADFSEIKINEARVEERVIPSSEDFLKKNPQMTKEQIETIQKQISENIKERQNLIKNQKVNFGNLKTKHEEYKLAIKNVLIHTRLVKKAFDQGPLTPPESLKEAYKIHQEEFEKLIKFQEKMEIISIALSVKIINNKSMGTEEIDEIFQENSYKEIIEKVTQLHEDYTQARIALREKLITSIEKGDLGEDYQKYIIAMYGKDSKGEFPKDDNSIYLKLQKITEELAILEAKILKLRNQEGDLYASYYSLLPYAPTGNVIKYKLSDILNGKKDNKDISIESEKDVLNFLEEHKSLFEKIYSSWKNMRSKTPPEFPSLRE